MKEEIMEQLINEAKKLVVRRADDGSERKWLETEVVPYGSPSEKVRFLVLEGSPARGYIIANYGMEKVTAFGCDGTRLKTYCLQDRYLRGWK